MSGRIFDNINIELLGDLNEDEQLMSKILGGINIVSVGIVVLEDAKQTIEMNYRCSAILKDMYMASDYIRNKDLPKDLLEQQFKMYKMMNNQLKRLIF